MNSLGLMGFNFLTLGCVMSYLVYFTHKLEQHKAKLIEKKEMISNSLKLEVLFYYGIFSLGVFGHLVFLMGFSGFFGNVQALPIIFLFVFFTWKLVKLIDVIE